MAHGRSACPHGSRRGFSFPQPRPGPRGAVADRRRAAAGLGAHARGHHAARHGRRRAARHLRQDHGDMIRQLTRCRIISRFGIGVDNVDIADGDDEGHRRHQGARLLHRRGLGPHHGAAAGGRAQDPVLERAGARRHLEDAGRRADPSAARQRARPGRLRPHSAARRAEGEGVRHAGRRLRPVRAGGGLRGRRGRAAWTSPSC